MSVSVNAFVNLWISGVLSYCRWSGKNWDVSKRKEEVKESGDKEGNGISDKDLKEKYKKRRKVNIQKMHRKKEYKREGKERKKNIERRNKKKK